MSKSGEKPPRPTFQDNIVESQGPQSMDLIMFNKMIEKKERQGGVVFGYHGTSAKRAEKIQKNGFQNTRDPVEGSFGVHFFDDEYQKNALHPAVKKAEEDGDSRYAVIKARCQNARPDSLRGRPQWLVNADDIEILDVQFYER